MKKLKIVFVGLLIAVTVFQIACKKGNSDAISLNLTESKTKTELALINAKYQRETSNNTASRWWSLREICNVFVQDVGGAWAGSWAGGKVGVLVGGPGGAGAGAVVGAVVVGAAASYSATPHNRNRISTNRSVPLSTIDINFTLDNPENNPYDELVGKRHNLLLMDNLIKNEGSTSTDINYLYSRCSLTINESIFLANDSGMTSNVFSAISETNSLDNIKELLQIKISDPQLVLIMSSYIDGISTISSLDNAIKLSYEYEKYVKSCISLTEYQKQILLEGLSVSKYSNQFWQRVL